MKEKKVQVTEAFLTKCENFITALRQCPDLEFSELAIEDTDYMLKEIAAIKEARIRRALYTGYKSAGKGTAGREQRRQQYLDYVGIHKDWRSSTEKAP